MKIVGWTKLKIKNDRNENLSALLKTAGRPESSKALVIVCHGFSGTKEGGGSALIMGERLANLSFSTLLFDFAGRGQSEGKKEEISLSNQIEDLGAVVREARDLGFEKLILNGRSFGGSTALGYAAKDQQIAGLCTWAAVAKPLELFTKRLEESLEEPGQALVTLAGEEGSLKVKRSFFQDLKHYNLVKEASLIAPRHFLIIHGTEDETVPCEEAVLLYEAAAHPKELALIEGADHRFSAHRAEVWRVFFKWLAAFA